MMIKLERITDPSHPYLKPLLDLFENAFPDAERRPLAQMKDYIVSEKQMHFVAVVCNDSLAGLFIYWQFPEFYYMEYLAIFPELRNQKIGAKVLSHVAESMKGVRIFEVEPPETEIAQRRIKMYERNGYEVADKEYIQPPYSPENHSILLWVMSNYSDLVKPEYIETIHRRVYGVSVK